MFCFEIIGTADGTQVIDMHKKTAYESLTPVQMIEYMEIDAQIAYMEKLKRKEKQEEKRKRKLAKKPLYRVACMCGLV